MNPIFRVFFCTFFTIFLKFILLQKNKIQDEDIKFQTIGGLLWEMDGVRGGGWKYSCMTYASESVKVDEFMSNSQ